MIVRILVVLIAIASVASIWLDPFTYTVHPAGPELAPLWWKTYAVLDTALLVALALNAGVANWWRAYLIMSLSVTLSLLMNAFYVWIRGVDRFLIIFQTEEILSVYLLMVALRVVGLFVCGAMMIQFLRRVRPAAQD